MLRTISPYATTRYVSRDFECRPVKLSRVRNINEAFEFLKNELEGFQKCPRVLVNLDDEV